MIVNIYMFIYSSIRLYNMQKSIHTSGQKTPYKYQKSKYSVKSTTSESRLVSLSRQESRADSGIEGSVALSRTTVTNSDGSETDTLGQNDTSHSPMADEVFKQGYTFKARTYARSLSSKIPTTKLSRQISKINNNKDR